MRNHMKKSIVVILLILVMLLQGCSSAEDTTFAFGTSEVEILTYRKLTKEKTQLIVSLTGNIYVSTLCNAFEEKNPDVEIVEMDITGGTGYCKPYVDQLVKGPKPDIMFLTGKGGGSYQPEEYLVDLSTYTLLENYQAEALDAASNDGKMFFLPGPSNAECILYNKTLFDRYGWKIPKSFDEFVALCDRITDETSGEVQAWNPNAKYQNELIKFFEGVCYGQLFAGINNRTWYHDFLNEDAKYADHMKPMYDMMQTLIDHGLVTQEHLTYSATTRWKEFLSGKIAMINFAINHKTVDSEYEFSSFPFPSLDGKEGFYIQSISSFTCVPKKEHTEAEQDAIDRFLAYLSTPEAQTIFIADSCMISNLKNSSSEMSGLLTGLKSAVDAGNAFSFFEFTEGGKLPNFNLYQHFVTALKGEKTLSDQLATVDKAPFAYAGDGTAIQEVITEATEDFNILDTSFLIADMYREKAGADIGLIANNVAFRGNVMRIHAGSVTPDLITVLKPRSFENNSTLIKIKMTGANLLTALNNPLGNNMIADCTYAYSGLKCEVAPWRPLGERMVSVALSDGTAIDPNKEYTVACWSGTVSEVYISEVLEAYEGTFEDLMTEKMTREKTVAPARDGRITLIWD